MLLDVPPIDGLGVIVTELRFFPPVAPLHDTETEEVLTTETEDIVGVCGTVVERTAPDVADAVDVPFAFVAVAV